MTELNKNKKDTETYDINQVIERIKKTLEMKEPSKKEILTYLYTLQADPSLSNFIFFDIIGKIDIYLNLKTIFGFMLDIIGHFCFLIFAENGGRIIKLSSKSKLRKIF